MEDRVVERDDQLAVIDRAVATARAGRGRSILVEAVMGMGKTALLRAGRRRAGAAGAATGWATAGIVEQDVPYGVLRQLFVPLLRALREDQRAGVLSGAAAAAGVLGNPAAPVPRLGPEVDHGVYWLAAGLAELRPLVLLVDDAHWADPPSLRALEHLGRRVEDVPVVLVLAARPRAGEPQATLLARAAAGGAAELLRLPPLTASGVAALLGEADDSPAVARCLAATGGTPLLVRGMAAPGAPEGADAGAGVARRVHALGPDAVAALRAVAVLDGEQPPARVAALAGLGRDAARAALDTLAGAGLVREGAGVAVEHPAVASAALEDAAPRERAALHERAARLLAGEGEPAERVAAHLLHADPAGDPWVVRQLREAAQAAAGAGAQDLAARYLRRALGEDGGPADPGLLLALGVAELQTGDPAGEAHLRDAVARGGLPDARRALAMALTVDNRAGEAARVLLDALDAAASREDALRVAADLALVQVLDLRVRAEAGDRLATLRRAPPPGATPAERAALGALALDGAFGNLPRDVVRERATTALADGALLREEGPALPLSAAAITALIFIGDVPEAMTWLEQSAVATRAAGRITSLGVLSCGIAMAHLWAGDLAAAEDEIELHARIGGASAAPVSDALGIMIRAAALLERRGPGAALARTAELDGLPPLDPRVLQGRLEQARAEAAAGDAAGAAERLRRLGATVREHGVDAPAIFPWRSALAALAHPQEAAELARAELALARGSGVPHAESRALRALARAVGGPPALEALADAVRLAGASAVRLEAAAARVDFGAALRRAGHRRDAVEHLRQGLDTADRCGATALAARARRELVAAGARPRRARVRGVEALTASERRVAVMAAAGATNRQIAQALFLVPKTVERHLTAAYAKLGISSRSELAAALRTGAEHAA